MLLCGVGCDEDVFFGECGGGIKGGKVDVVGEERVVEECI